MSAGDRSYSLSESGIRRRVVSRTAYLMGILPVMPHAITYNVREVVDRRSLVFGEPHRGVRYGWKANPAGEELGAL